MIDHPFSAAKLSRQKPENAITQKVLLDWILPQIPSETRPGDPVFVVTNLVESRAFVRSQTQHEDSDHLVSVIRAGVLDSSPFVYAKGSDVYFAVHGCVVSSEQQRQMDGAIAILFPGDRDGHLADFLWRTGVSGLIQGLDFQNADIYKPIPVDQEEKYWLQQGGWMAYEEFLKKKEQGLCAGVYPLEIIVGHERIQEFCIERGSKVTSAYLSLWRSLENPAPLHEKLAEHDVREREKVAEDILEVLKKL